jgi:alpha-amylase
MYINNLNLFLIIKDVNHWIRPVSNNGAMKEVNINAETNCGNDWVWEQ